MALESHLLPSSSHTAQCEGNSTLGGCGQEDKPPSPLNLQLKLISPQEEQASSTSHHSQLYVKGVMLEDQELPSSTQPQLGGWIFYPRCGGLRIWGGFEGGTNFPHPSLLIGWRLHAGQGKLRRSEAVAPA